jgi:hypothetical protein
MSLTAYIAFMMIIGIRLLVNITRINLPLETPDDGA